jgi:hypothetical protein
MLSQQIVERHRFRRFLRFLCPFHHRSSKTTPALQILRPTPQNFLRLLYFFNPSISSSTAFASTIVPNSSFCPFVMCTTAIPFTLSALSRTNFA